MRKFILKQSCKERQAALLKMTYVIGLLQYNIAKNFDKLVIFIKCFPNTSFTKQVLGLFLIFHWESFLGKIEPWIPPLSTMDS